MNILDFAELKSHYTGGHNKRKWEIINPDLLKEYLKQCNYKPSILAKKLNTSYSTIKRFLCSASLWHLAIIKKQNGKKSGRKRKAIQDKFGYELADAKYDRLSTNGETIRRFKHHVIAEEKYGRSLNDKEIVHHIDCNKKNNNLNNIYICKDNIHHRLLHGSLERAAGKAVAAGIIRFDEDRGYYLNEEWENNE